MIKNYHFCLLFLITCLLLSSNVSAQYQSRGKELNYVDAENFYKTHNYYDALPLFELLMLEYPKIEEYQLKAGICQLHLTNNPEKAIEYLENLYNKKHKSEDIEFYLAQAYALNYRFDIAIETFEKSLANKKISIELKNKIPLLMQQCKNAVELMKDSIAVEIINLGESINTIDNEYSPTINADESILIYTYKGSKSTGGRQDEFNREEDNGNFYEDIYIYQLSKKMYGLYQSLLVIV